MATMLGFLATDAAVEPALMNELAKRLADASFNRVTVDGDTSTNDSFVVVATGQAGNAPITDLNSPDGQALVAGLDPGGPAAGPCHRARRRRCDQVHHHPGGRWAKHRRVSEGGLCRGAFAAGEDSILCQRSQSWAHSGGGGLCRHC